MAALIDKYEEEQQEMQAHRHGMLKNLGEVSHCTLFFWSPCRPMSISAPHLHLTVHLEKSIFGLPCPTL